MAHITVYFATIAVVLVLGEFKFRVPPAT